MYDTEDFVWLLVKERMRDGMRYAEQRRVLRLARASRPTMRFRLGRVLIRFGGWLMGETAPSGGASVRLGRA